jgi:hypothetical protein
VIKKGMTMTEFLELQTMIQNAFEDIECTDYKTGLERQNESANLIFIKAMLSYGGAIAKTPQCKRTLENMIQVGLKQVNHVDNLCGPDVVDMIDDVVDDESQDSEPAFDKENYYSERYGDL